MSNPTLLETIEASLKLFGWSHFNYRVENGNLFYSLPAGWTVKSEPLKESDRDEHHNRVDDPADYTYVYDTRNNLVAVGHRIVHNLTLTYTVRLIIETLHKSPS